MEDFYVITMKTKNYKNLFLGVDMEEGNFKWFFNADLAIWFDRDIEAENLAKNHFKNFDKWEVKKLHYDVDKNKLEVL